jgi:hypothetical protein
VPHPDEEGSAVSISTHQVAAAVAAGLRLIPDLDLVVADNLRDRSYYLAGSTIYLNGALTCTKAGQAIIAAVNELTTGAAFAPRDEAQVATVIPFERGPRRAG